MTMMIVTTSNLMTMKNNINVQSVEKDEPANVFAVIERTPSPPPPAQWEKTPGRLHKSFSIQFQERIDPNKHFSEDDIVCNAWLP